MRKHPLESTKQEQQALAVQPEKPGLLDRFFKLSEHRTSVINLANK